MHTLAVAVTEGVPIFELAIPCEVFGYEREGLAGSWYDFRLCAAPGTRTAAGFAPHAGHGLDALAEADTVVIPACASVLDDQPSDLVEAVRAAHGNGARVVSLCTGAFVLAAAGILDGRPATTHWMHAAQLAARYPKVLVDASVLYIDDGDVLTSAGTAAGLDLCLHVVRNDHGAAVAGALAKRLVMPAHRPGGQAQYIDAAIPVPDADELGPLLDWARHRLHEPLTVTALARRANVTPRTLIRRFHAATGTTPMAWLRGIRIDHARGLLETTDLPVDQIAERSGLGTPANLRHHFTRAVGVPPTTYRRTFSELRPGCG
ncbi:helix-turn-helix domain-containing protein [Actinomadura darangshiensis]|uniref:Helix-turn-helix domain-containing protein n=1 Tax=Actinomadura darangshiensis TaxID=705336 RepID=A0A4R5AQ29_9ACTN|nr:helix-turn-helix domain-containing protein [Actinomadura darangshiensis]TDD74265.1 helix-turn-helix domain-containing protein [Actinomadura darangshiensis]